MKELTPLEKEFFFAIHGRPDRTDGTEDAYFIDEAKDAASLCSEKIRRAIELARELKLNQYGYENWVYTPDEIMQKLSEPQK